MTSWLDGGNDRLRRYVRIVFGLAFLLGGCNRDAPMPPRQAQTSAKPPAIAKQASAPAPEKQSVAEPKAAESSPPVVASPDSNEEPAEAAEERARPERIAILTPGGPLIADVWLTIDGHPHGDVFAELVKVVLDAGDTDNDGRVTWKELADNKEYLAALRPNAPPIGARQMTMFIERYDENKDGQIQPGEAASWLGRDAGVTASAFAMRSNRSYSPSPRATSRVWQLLDANRDGELSIDETDGAANKLMLLDGDDDRVIAPPELATLREQLEADRNQAIAVNREAGRYAALHLEPAFDMDRLEYLLSDLYAPRQTLGPSSFPELAELYKSIDENSDDWLEQLELADLLSIDPHLELAISFNQSDSTQAYITTLEIRHQVPVIEVVARPSLDRVVLRLGATLLIVSAHDLAAVQPDGQAANLSQIRLMVHDQYDALFEELDANSDGRLGEREIFTSPERLRSRDSDGDGRLNNEELPYSMIVAFLRGERANEQSYYLPGMVTKPSSAASAPEWFRHADFNSDGDVSRREFLGSLEQFSQLDSSQDGYVDAAEAAAHEPK